MSMKFPTPHIKATPEDFAKTVLMPGDPLRARFVAENFLDNAALVNNVRGVQGYTGTYKGARVSVMASGMGIPSMGIYSHELFNVFDVDNIIRIGSAGAINGGVNLRDIVIAQGACTNSNYAATFGLPGTFAPIASYKLIKTAAEVSEEIGATYHVGNILSGDVFYDDNEGVPQERQPNALWAKMGVLAIDMEAAGLYMEAARAGKNALTICTVSDQLIRGEALSSEERQTSFTEMMTIALETARRL